MSNPARGCSSVSKADARCVLQRVSQLLSSRPSRNQAGHRIRTRFVGIGAHTWGRWCRGQAVVTSRLDITTPITAAQTAT